MKSASKNYVLLGTCVTMFDEGGSSSVDLFKDITDFSQSLGIANLSDQISKEDQIEDVREVTYSEVKNNGIKVPVDSKMNNLSFFFNATRNYYVIYDESSDLHYIYSPS